MQDNVNCQTLPRKLIGEMHSAVIALVAIALGEAAAELCAGDPTKNVGDSWLCANGCDTCTCLDDGSISAAGCFPEDGGEPPEAEFEETVVRIATYFAALCFVCCLAVCYMLQKKGGATNAAQLVRELEDIEEQ